MEQQSSENHPFMEPNNVVIICVGLGLLIVPVICAMIWVCVHKKVFHHMRTVTLKPIGIGDDSDLPYSKFPYGDYEEKTVSSDNEKHPEGISTSHKNSHKIPPTTATLPNKTSKSNAYVITDDVNCDTPTFKLPHTPPLQV